jgi:hypothetical protein
MVIDAAAKGGQKRNLLRGVLFCISQSAEYTAERLAHCRAVLSIGPEPKAGIKDRVFARLHALIPPLWPRTRIKEQQCSWFVHFTKYINQ